MDYKKNEEEQRHLYYIWENHSEAVEYFTRECQDCQTENICLSIVAVNPHVIEYIQESNRTEKVCLEAVKRDISLLRFVPDRVRTENFHVTILQTLSANACSAYSNAIDYSELTEKIALQFIERNVNFFSNFPDRIKTHFVCMSAVKMKGSCLRDVPSRHLSGQLCDIALGIDLEYHPQRKPALIIDVPEEHKTYDRCFAAVKINCDNIKFVPKEIITEEMALTAVKQNGYMLGRIPDNLRSFNVCLQALINAPNLLEVPHKFLFANEILNAFFSHEDALFEVFPEFMFEFNCTQDCRNVLNLLEHCVFDSENEIDRFNDCIINLGNFIAHNGIHSNEQLDLFDQLYEQIERLKLNELGRVVSFNHGTYTEAEEIQLLKQIKYKSIEQFVQAKEIFLNNEPSFKKGRKQSKCKQQMNSLSL